jgi:hypothetical protein
MPAPVSDAMKFIITAMAADAIARVATAAGSGWRMGRCKSRPESRNGSQNLCHMAELVEPSKGKGE